MLVEMMLYSYLGICVAMIIFNIVCIFAFRASDKRLSTREARFGVLIHKELLRLEKEGTASEEHRELLKKELRRVGYLQAFDGALEKSNQSEAALAHYFATYHDVFGQLALYYKKKAPTKAAYFPYVMAKYKVLCDERHTLILDTMYEYLHRDNFYCRNNAMNAIFSSDNIPMIVAALHYIEDDGMHYDEKLMTEGLLKHATKHAAICQALLDERSRFQVPMQQAIINFCRLSGEDFAAPILALLKDEGVDDEVRFACMRYFGSHPCAKAQEVLVDLANAQTATRWEYVSIASKALARYKSEDVVHALKKNLCSSNWHVRQNAAQSLANMGLEYGDLQDVFDGNDRYAREIMRYELEVREHKLAGGGQSA